MAILGLIGIGTESVPAQANSVEALPGFDLDVELGAESEPKIDRLRLDKSERRLILMSRGYPIYEYEVSLGGSPDGPKREQGDERTPEGRYIIDGRKVDSDYHLALHISYPNEQDRERARERGVDPGGAIMIHGLPNGLGVIGAAHLMVDWTDGCIAVTNEEMEEIWRRVPDGAEIDIRP